MLKHVPNAPKDPEEIKKIIEEGVIADGGAFVIEAYGKKDDEINDIAFYYDMYLESTKLIAIAYAYLRNKDEMVHHVFDDAMAELGALSFTRLKTIDYIHPNCDNSCKFYHVALEHFHEEKKQVFLETKPYDYIEYEVTKGELFCQEIGKKRMFNIAHKRIMEENTYLW